MNLTLLGKRAFAEVMKPRIMRGDHPGLSRWACNLMTRVIIRRPQRDGKGGVNETKEAEVRAMGPQVKEGMLQPPQGGRGKDENLP